MALIHDQLLYLGDTDALNMLPVSYTHLETQGETKDINGRVFRTSDGVFMHVKARSVDNGSTSLDKEVKKIIKDRTIPEPTVKMVLYLLSMM